MMNKRISIVTTLLIFIISASINTGFAQTNTILKDIDNHWAKWYINQLTSLGYIDGYPDSTFKPDNNISVAEFMKLTTVAVLGKDYKIEDVKDRYWYSKYLAEAKRLGLVEDGEFNDYNRNITRDEMIKMAIKGLSNDIIEGNTKFNDDNKIEEKYKPYINKATSMEIIDGYPDGTFKPKGTATRAEATKVLVELLRNKGVVTEEHKKEEIKQETVENNEADYIDISEQVLSAINEQRSKIITEEDTSFGLIKQPIANMDYNDNLSQYAKEIAKNIYKTGSENFSTSNVYGKGYIKCFGHSTVKVSGDYSTSINKLLSNKIYLDKGCGISAGIGCYGKPNDCVIVLIVAV